jgi:hypothetical protein
MIDKLFGLVRKYDVYILLSAYFAAGLLTIIFFDGTGDDGDSVMHYFFAKYAPVHPELYFDHWAKPLFVMISSPFAQFGFAGMKLFNLCVSSFTFYLTFQTARLLGIRNPLLVIVFLVFTPLYYVLTFSGLTEPLFALFLIGAIFLVLRNGRIAASLVVSFMPFVRSEGLIFIGVFGLYFMLSRQWKYLPWLLTGHLVLSLAGFFVYHDLLWVFNRIPYASLEPKYGSGPLLHFVFQLNYVLGVPLYFLMIAGVISYPVNYFRKAEVIRKEEYYLVVTGAFAFILTHSLFWYFGIFSSMGLKRVLLCIVPLASLISLRGFNMLLYTFPLNSKIRVAAGGVVVLYISIFPFMHNPASIHWDTEMQLTASQSISKGVAHYLKDKPVAPNGKYYYAAPYLGEALHLDPFSNKLRADLNSSNLMTIKTGDVVIWDNWFAVVESGITLESLTLIPGLTREIDFNSPGNGEKVSYVLFRKE